MLKKISIALLALIIIVVTYAYFQPKDIKISRQITINATPEAIFPNVNNSMRSNVWMPWKAQDPQIQMTYSGPDDGVGSKASWTSEGKMGDGEAEIIESTPNTAVKTQLRYFKPMQMEQITIITLTPANGATLVNWEVQFEQPLIGRIFCLFMNLDKMIGTEFEKGLINLKALVEAHNPGSSKY